MTKKVAVLGATGSVGRQCIEVLLESPERWEVKLLSGFRNEKLLHELSAKFPKAKIVGEAETACLADPDVYRGIDLVVNAIGGMAGLKPTFAVLESGATLATANKESLVAASALFRKEKVKRRAVIIPVDSEHSALFRCMQGENKPRTLYLTASGGPFRDYTKEEIALVTPSQALNHPTWKMGKKVTLDSATMMNKGFELIEAQTLFELEEVEILVHRESVVHGIVEFQDGALKALMSAPSMKDPIRYALGYPETISCEARTDLVRYGTLHFEAPDEKKFPAIGLARRAAKGSDYVKTVLVASNEGALTLFEQRKIDFYGITDLVEAALDYFGEGELSNVEEVLRMNRAVMEYTVKNALQGGGRG